MKIYLSFFFSLLPGYLSENPEFKVKKATRNILFRNKTVNDLQIKFYQVINYFNNFKYLTF